jgi:hypothetical protein
VTELTQARFARALNSGQAAGRSWATGARRLPYLVGDFDIIERFQFVLPDCKLWLMYC